MLKSPSELLAEVSEGLRIVDAVTASAELGSNGGLLIDVREPGEVSAQPVAAAVNVPRGLLEFKLPELVPEADRPLYLHCASGGRARLGAEQLLRLGYSEVCAISCDAVTVCSAFDG